MELWFGFSLQNIFYRFYWSQSIAKNVSDVWNQNMSTILFSKISQSLYNSEIYFYKCKIIFLPYDRQKRTFIIVIKIFIFGVMRKIVSLFAMYHIHFDLPHLRKWRRNSGFNLQFHDSLHRTHTALPSSCTPDLGHNSTAASPPSLDHRPY